MSTEIKVRKNIGKYRIVKCSSCGTITKVKEKARYEMCSLCMSIRKDEKSDPRIMGTCILIKAGDGNRCSKNLDCNKYSECLKIVADLNWKGFVNLEKKTLSIKLLQLVKILMRKKI